MASYYLDSDPQETQEWVESLEAVIKSQGVERGQHLLQKLWLTLKAPLPLNTPYQNTISPQEQTALPEDYALCARVMNILRWNAIAMVIRAGKIGSELGGHLATYSSSALLYELLFNYFLRARSSKQLEDLVYYQGHAIPGIYARAFLEGRLSESQLTYFRQESEQKGVSSYPHPWLMPNFWQFATVSMGLGPLQAIHQARFLNYLHHRSLVPLQDRKIWVFCGDGEMDEPESLGMLSLAAREQLDNLIFVINCNLQRLDGPVRGNGKIIQELEGIFTGAGWRVIKAIWSSDWDRLLARDTQGLLLARMEACLDGDYQSWWTQTGADIREKFFGVSPELKAMVADWSDEELRALGRAGHDPVKIYAAYSEAIKTKNQPTVILVKSFKGYGMGSVGEGQNEAHQQKKLTTEQLVEFCQRFDLPLTSEQIADVQFYKPDGQTAEIQFMNKRRQALGGYLPERHSECEKLTIPPLSAFNLFLEGARDRDMSTTMAFVRILAILLKDPHLSSRIVPIVPDESRTFGMEGLFRQIGIYSPLGQLYEPQDKHRLSYYREAKDGQLLQEGISEAGAFCSWIAAATSYSTNAFPMIPFYIYYSMFGFQRTGDLAWAAGDMRARGFLLGATAGRTTLGGEGLQHNDGHSHLLYDVIPNCRCYDPAFAYELAVIIHHGLQRMYEDQVDEFYYLTLMNENYHHPAMPAGVEADIIRGLYLFQKGQGKGPVVQLLGSGTILLSVLEAAALLIQDFGVVADVWSVTSFTELYREIEQISRQNLLATDRGEKLRSHVARCFQGLEGPFIAATDYLKRQADLIRRDVPGPYVVLGTDGYGRSDTRKRLRAFFEVDAFHIAYAAMKSLFEMGKVSEAMLEEAKQKYGISEKKPDPLDL